MSGAMLSNRITVANEVAELRRMSDWLWTCGAAAGISPEVLQHLDVCANEAVYNIIRYAYADCARHEIEMELSKTAEGARLLIRDDGKPFNMLDAPAPAQPRNLDEAEAGGLGIHLIRRLTAHCDYERRDGFNLLGLEARRQMHTSDA